MIASEKKFQATSFLGESLYSRLITNPEQKNKLLQALKKAKVNYDAASEDADNIIWYGRRMAYTRNFRKAITIFSEGIEKHHNDAHFYRHRGHRYISTRELDNAIADLEKASRLIKGSKNQIEPDGAPNKYNIPISSAHGNIWTAFGYIAAEADVAFLATDR